MIGKPKITWAILLLIAIAALSWNIFNSAIPVKTVTVTRTTAVDAVPAAVKVDPEFELTITSDVSGLIKETSLKRGQIVKKGDLLMEIDPGVYVIELQRLTRELENIEAQYALNYDKEVALRLKKEDLDYYERLTKNGEYPQLELTRRRDEFRIFTEQQEKEQLARQQHLSNIKHNIQLQKDSIAACIIKAPAAGTVTEIYAQPGEVVSLRSPLVRLFSESLLVEARINEEDFSGITIGLPASVRFLAYGPQLYDAKVVKVLPNADPQNQQYRCYLEVNIDAGDLIPGLSGEASILRNKRENTLVAPRAALYNDTLFIINDGRARSVKAQLGFKSLSAIELLSGAAEGDVLALTNLSKLRDGSKVSVQK
jgi:RND family efflux transporter MFP subunit